MTNEERMKVERLGLVEKKQKVTGISETLNVVQILTENGIDFKKFKLSKTEDKVTKPKLLKDIEEDGIDIKKIIKENDLDENFHIGSRIISLRMSYNGKRGIITEEEKRRAEELGLLYYDNKQEALRIVGILRENGVNIAELKFNEKLLKELRQKTINIEKIIKENDLDEDFPIGRTIVQMKKAYKGKGRYTITDDQKKEMEALGLVGKKKKKKTKEKKKKTAVLETLEIAKVLKENGVDFKKIKLSKENENGNRIPIILKEIKQEGIDIEKIIKENNLNRNFKFGSRVTTLRNYYNNDSSKMTDEERALAEELGLIKTKNIKGYFKKIKANKMDDIDVQENNNNIEQDDIYIQENNNYEEEETSTPEVEGNVDDEPKGMEDNIEEITSHEPIISTKDLLGQIYELDLQNSKIQKEFQENQNKLKKINESIQQIIKEISVGVSKNLTTDIMDSINELIEILYLYKQDRIKINDTLESSIKLEKENRQRRDTLYNQFNKELKRDELYGN